MAVRRRGFTLIELLTVIAIISILAGLIAVGAPQVLLRARTTSVEGTMKQIGNTMASYFADHGSYPPGYGYVRFEAGALSGPQSAWIQPWHAILGIYDQQVYVDAFSDNADMNRNGTIDLLEYMPIGNAQNQYPGGLFTGEPAGGDVAPNVNQQRTNQRAFLYVPINMEDFRKVESYFNFQGDNYIQRQKALVWNQSDPRLAAILNRTNAAPPRYDAYVLISIGPSEQAVPIIANPPAGSSRNPYYYAGLITYYLATRDTNNNGQADYDYRSRTGGGKDKEVASFADPALQTFPDGSNYPGPMIFQSK